MYLIVIEQKVKYLFKLKYECMQKNNTQRENFIGIPPLILVF